MMKDPQTQLELKVEPPTLTQPEDVGEPVDALSKSEDSWPRLPGLEDLGGSIDRVLMVREFS